MTTSFIKSQGGFQIFAYLLALVAVLLLLATRTTTIRYFDLGVLAFFIRRDVRAREAQRNREVEQQRAGRTPPPGGWPAAPPPPSPAGCVCCMFEYGAPQPTPYAYVAPMAWVIVLTAATVAQHYFHWGHSIGHFVGVWIMTTGIFGFFSWDANKTEHTLGADAYLQGAVSFYVDFIKVFSCMLCCWCNLVIYCVGYYALGEQQESR